MRLSVVIPCYNEKETVADVVKAVAAVDLGGETEIVVVDDASADGTGEVIAELRKSFPQLRLVTHDSNRGKGAALRTGFARATGEAIVIQDADREYDPADLPRVLAPLRQGKADVVFGSRFAGGQTHRVLYFWHSLGNRFLTLLTNVFSNLNLSDMEVCYKAFRREVLERITLRENRFGFEPEFTLKVARLGCRIYEVGISYSGRTYAEGKKIGWRDGLRALYVILKYGLFSR